MLLNKEKELYKEKGFFIKKNFIDSNSINQINSLIDNLTPKNFIPYSKSVPWGYGNLMDNKDFIDTIKMQDKAKYLSNFLATGNIICNLLLIVNKAEFIGPDVEWHQEFLNLDTYAPGYSCKNDLDKFLQVFIALDDHRIDNGPLYVFESSHKEGILPCEDIINSHLNHKRRLTFKSLKYLSENYECMPVLLGKGDAIVFNHLLAHGSPPNLSKYRRRAMVMQFKIEKYDRDQELFIKESSHRNNFIIKELEKKKEIISSKNMYSVYK